MAGALLAATIALSTALQAGLGGRLPMTARFAISVVAIIVALLLKEPGAAALLPVELVGERG